MRKLTYMLAGVLLLGLSGVASASLSSWLLPDTYTKTKYPIVLVHGLFGFDEIIGLEYFYKIPEELRRSGAEVFVAQVSAANSHEVRGEQLARQIEDILAISGAERVNLIGHSQGSPTSRYIASVYPQYVASVTSVGGVNWGAPLADVLLDENDEADPFIEYLGNAFMSFIDWASEGGNPQDINAALVSLSTEGSVAFNQLHPYGVPSEFCGDGDEIGPNGVRYFSWTGTRIFTNALDISDPLMGATSLAFTDGEPNDGLVGRCSARLGRVIREDYRMNHLDEVNQVLGLVSLLETNPKTVYRQHANRLKGLGL